MENEKATYISVHMCMSVTSLTVDNISSATTNLVTDCIMEEMEKSQCEV